MAKKMQRCYSMMHSEPGFDRFHDRSEAAHQLAAQLRMLNPMHPLILALPMGGVPIAGVIGRTLGCEIDVLVVKKISPAHQPELSVGALVEDGEPVWNERYITALEVRKEEFDPQIAQLREEIRHQRQKWKTSASIRDLRGRTVILVGDGSDSAAALTATVRDLRRRHPDRLILALPIGLRSVIQELQPVLDRTVCLREPATFYAAEQFYFDFSPVSEEEVIHTLSTRPSVEKTNRFGYESRPAGPPGRQPEER